MDLVVTRALSAVPGVGRVTRVGGVSREIRVDLDPDRMAALGATASDVSRQLRRIQAEYPGGEARFGGLEQTVRTTGTISSVYDLAALPISLSRRAQRAARHHRRRSRSGRRDSARWRCSTASPSIGFEIVRSRGAPARSTWPKRRARPSTQLAKEYPQIKFAEASSTVGYIQTSFDSSMEMLVEGAILGGDRGLALPARLARNPNLGRRAAAVDHPDVLGDLRARAIR